MSVQISLADTYFQWFDVVEARTPEQLSEAYRLRFQVYCLECAYEDPGQNADTMETDEFDCRAPHVLLIHRNTSFVAGTVRLILPSPDNPAGSFPIQRICTDPLLKDPAAFPIARMGEISRFSISKDFRRRLGDTLYPRNEIPGEDDRRVIPNMCLGLMQGVLRMSIENGGAYFCAEMEPILLRLLGRLGIHFTPIGPLVDFHGKRQPCLGKVADIVARLRRERPECWEVVTNKGRLHPVS